MEEKSEDKIKKYLKPPTHTKEGWLVYVGLFLIVGFIANLIRSPGDIVTLIIFGSIQWVLIIAFIIELIAIIRGKNK